MKTVIRERTDPPIWRLVAAFLIVPGAAAFLMAILMPAYDGINAPFERIWRSAVAFALFGAYPTTLLVGLPVFLLLRTRLAPTLINCSLAGAAVAALPWLVLSLLDRPETASIDGKATIAEGSYTAYGWITNLAFMGQIALLGAAGGLLFWLIATAGRRHSNDRK